jgi:2-methylcitrate dehydratase PrpD
VSAVDDLAELVVSEPELDDAERAAASRAVLDTVAVAVAGRAEPVTGTVCADADTVSAADGAAAGDWVGGTRRPVAEAAYVNGVAAHALDFDDVSMAMSGHPSALLVPVAVAVGEARGRTVEEVLSAYAVGLRVDVGVSAGFDLVRHYDRGWHASVTVGILGAVAAAATLERLTREQTRHALGLAVSMASGTRQNFGTMTKPLHVGLAAHNAVRATRLAALGADASPVALEGPLGFYALFGGGSFDPGSFAASLRQSAAASLRTLSVKRYPCCYQAHRAVDAALDVRTAVGADLESQEVVDRVVVTVNPGSDTSLIHPYATTATQARFSLRYVVATALVDGAVDFGSFTTEQVGREEVQALMRRIDIEHSVATPYETLPYELDYAAVEVRLASGRSVHVTCTAPRGSAARPLSDDELVDKVDGCLVHGGVKPEASALAATLRRPAAPVSELVDTLTDLIHAGVAR